MRTALAQKGGHEAGPSGAIYWPWEPHREPTSLAKLGSRIRRVNLKKSPGEKQRTLLVALFVFQSLFSFTRKLIVALSCQVSMSNGPAFLLKQLLPTCFLVEPGRNVRYATLA